MAEHSIWVASLLSPMVLIFCVFVYPKFTFESQYFVPGTTQPSVFGTNNSDATGPSWSASPLDVVVVILSLQGLVTYDARGRRAFRDVSTMNPHDHIYWAFFYRFGGNKVFPRVYYVYLCRPGSSLV